MSTGDVPPDVIPPSSSDTGLHSFTKLAIAYVGILLGLTIISVILGTVVTFDNPSNVISLSGNDSYLLAYYAILIPMMLATIELLRRGKKIGAFLAYPTLAIHYTIYYPTLLFLITSPIVGILLWRSLRYLH
jgi:hypothetical protein